MTSRDGIDKRSMAQEPDVFSGGELLGSDVGNTDPSKLQIVAGGVDWCKVYAYGVEAPPELFERVTAQREAAEKAGKLNELFTSLQSLGMGDDRREWRVLPAEGQGGCRMSVVLQRGDVRIGLRQKSGAQSGPVASFEFTGRGCSGLKPLRIYDLGAQLLGSFGVHIERTTLSRVDVCVDAKGITVADFNRWEESERCVRRARHFDSPKNGRQRETIYVGKRGGDVCARIYDKSKELTRAGNEDKAQEYCQTWGFDSVPEGVVRVEFELRAELFGGSDARGALGILDRYVCALFERWVRFTDRPVDRRHIERSKGGVIWERLKAGMLERLEKASDAVVELRKVVPSVTRRVRSLFGGLASFAALIGSGAETLPDMLCELVRYSDERDENWLFRRAKQRAREFAVRFADLGAVVCPAGGGAAGGTQCSGGTPGI